MKNIQESRSYFKFTPSMQGQTINLRPLVANDFERLYAVASDPLIWEQHPNQDLYLRTVFSQWFSKALKDGALVVEDRATKKIIGSSRYYDLDEEQSVVVIGYTFLARSYWGGKTNLELKHLMLSHAFGTVKTVWFHIGAINQRSQKAIVRLGAIFSHKGIKKIHGKDVDYMLYYINKPLLI